ncbi:MULTISPECIES: GNAT family N-acetyltransferase [Microbacterium]|uniref:GNAT family N-acetyltransferase n=1 Tax=Microbacterium TaxID=33882 RepID=UPI00197BF38D|nr:MULTISPECIES: GNAT family N-acetyltransferase [Microbacterium]
MRLLCDDDAPELAAVYERNRDHLSPWEPLRPEGFHTPAWHREDIARWLELSEAGRGFSFGIFDGGELVGRLNFVGIVRGAFQSATLGYWIDAGRAGRGLATAAVGEAVRMARDELALHRLEACTLPHNAGSQRVLEKSGFQRIGSAPQYLQIAGSWQDHDLFQKILHEQDQVGAG